RKANPFVPHRTSPLGEPDAPYTSVTEPTGTKVFMSYAVRIMLELGFDSTNTRPNVGSTASALAEKPVPCNVPISVCVSGSQMRPPNEYKSPFANLSTPEYPCKRLLVVVTGLTPDAATENLTNSNPLEKLS